MKFTTDKQDNYVLIKLNEDKLTSLISSELKTELVMINSQEYKNIILDLSDTGYCDSSGLSAILVGNRLCKNSSGSFILTNLNEHVKKLISISQLDNILTIIPTVSEAVDYILMEHIEKNLDSE
ncbi:MAG: STAS domain-containing protein [Bacteroidia bacterium]|nr:STAS domain-containing protein [Bacteroidia bacterium]